MRMLGASPPASCLLSPDSCSLLPATDPDPDPAPAARLGYHFASGAAAAAADSDSAAARGELARHY